MAVRVRVEISVESIEGVRIAARHGADRVELCGALSDGGLTPSAALMELASARADKTEVHALIRPRPGDFRYTPDEVSVMIRDIRAADRAGVTGMVIGALGEDGLLDPICERFVDAAEHKPVTLHRAIDVSADPRRVLDQAMELGFKRVLTSGQQRSALDGAPLIKSLVAQAGDDIEVMACGGVRASNVLEVVAATGVSDVHAGVRAPVRGVAGGAVSYAGIGVPEGFDHFETDADGVAALMSVIRG
ncbi:copper homeostasis protein CutC [Kibdelosporangium persicum]|uniref:PF03932 family protein CutC n=1 Tax=Kibdelosporangium persicum TaxID=2698649 RepID=A0ABX2F4D6_9PSEU|nr:copper homeostasis protein CutC [Kibdelosporangium persicum]NRN66199.1 Copper homeostasis protein CutC [Kibdelosporangium persicum]